MLSLENFIEVPRIEKNINNIYNILPVKAFFHSPKLDSEGDLECKDLDLSVEDFFKERFLDWTKVKTIFFDRGCITPRYKLAEFLKNKNIRIVRNKNKADIIFFGESTFSDSLSYDYDQIMNRNNLISLLKKERTKERKLAKELENYKSEYVFFHSSLFSNISEIDYSNSCTCSYYLIKSSTIFEDSKYCPENFILKNMNSQILDEETFNNLDIIFNSKDLNSHKLAFDVMTNYNYDKSFVYFCELLRRHWKKISSKVDTSVSFKAMKKYLNYNYKYRNDYDNMINCLIKRNLFTKNNSELIRNFTIKLLNEKNEDIENYIIKDIEFTEDIKKKIIKSSQESN